ncbi:MAG: hypothetical protein IPG17_22710 [Sandaracinaceae bacterium]|nr:hypothetical protein [Sandaracinaceae bacterium]
MTTSREDELEALRRTLLAEGIRETADPDTSLGRGDLLPGSAADVPAPARPTDARR